MESGTNVDFYKTVLPGGDLSASFDTALSKYFLSQKTQ